MRLHQRPGVAGVGFEVEGARGVGVEHRIVLDLLVGRQADHGVGTAVLAGSQALGAGHDADRLGAAGRRFGSGASRLAGGLFHRIGVGMLDQRPRRIDLGRIHGLPFVRWHPTGGHHESGTAQIANVADFFALGQAVRDLDDGPLGIAENQQIGLRIGQHGTTNLVRPVVVVGNAAQAGLDRADDDRHPGIGLPATLGVNGDRTIRSFVRLGVGRIGVVGADLAVSRIAVDHRVHVAGGNTVEQVGLAELAEIGWPNSSPAG